MLHMMANRSLGHQRAQNHSYIPCFTRTCFTYEMLLYEANYLHDIKVVGAHMSYHIPMERSPYEDQVLITNFRDPVSRIKSSMLYLYQDHVEKVFGNAKYTKGWYKSLVEQKG